MLNKQGYTLVEVTLFLALSSMLSLIAFVGLGPRLRNVRFTSGIRTISDTITKQSSNLTVGVNKGSDAYVCKKVGSGLEIRQNPSGITGASEDCVVNGRIFYFDTDKMTTYYISSLSQPTSTNCISSAGNNDLAKLLCYSPSVQVDSTPPTPVDYSYPNGIEFTKSVDGNGPNGSRAFGYIVNPETNVRTQFVVGTAPVKPTSGTFTASNIVLNTPKSYCFALSGRIASLRTTPDSIIPKLTFEDTAC